ncbi:hypothetical protein LSF60_12925 [Rhodococcus pyridinivorans]|uniref:hypothetical protein n=1 Tax=Rhodococcus pyridinivorans TaxID=103816 RepID=UPI001E4ADCF7|nr:hypothetical protein [Rhodococcus pyridinivorans]UGQ56285.1 hypothetical protein LSF60_12925 [Rhodococcus pyridinivorans]
MPLPRTLARFDKIVTNRVTTPFAQLLPGTAVVEHRGRRSGRVALQAIRAHGYLDCTPQPHR